VHLLEEHRSDVEQTRRRGGRRSDQYVRVSTAERDRRLTVLRYRTMGPVQRREARQTGELVRGRTRDVVAGERRRTVQFQECVDVIPHVDARPGPTAEFKLLRFIQSSSSTATASSQGAVQTSASEPSRDESTDQTSSGAVGYLPAGFQSSPASTVSWNQSSAEDFTTEEEPEFPLIDFADAPLVHSSEVRRANPPSVNDPASPESWSPSPPPVVYQWPVLDVDQPSPLIDALSPPSPFRSSPVQQLEEAAMVVTSSPPAVPVAASDPREMVVPIIISIIRARVVKYFKYKYFKYVFEIHATYFVFDVNSKSILYLNTK
jgi:hypothetical protein